MRNGLLLLAVICALLFAAAAGSKVSGQTAPQAADSEPITGTAAVTAPGSETVQKDPFKPYDIGPDAGIPYSDLSDPEKALADKGRDTAGWQQVADTFANASSELAQRAAGEAAQHQLGVDNLGGTGVVP